MEREDENKIGAEKNQGPVMELKRVLRKGTCVFRRVKNEVEIGSFER